MAISRPFLLALIGLALLGATVFAVQNSRDSATNEAAPVADQGQAQPAESASEPAKLSPQQSLESALASDGLKSAAFDAELAFAANGERASMSAEGAFELGGPSDMPKLDIRANVESPDLDVAGGFLTTGDKAWFTRGDTAYAVPEDTWGKIVEAVEKGAGGQRSSRTPDLGVDPARWLRNLKSEDGGEVNGAETTHVSAEIDSAGAVTDLAKAMDQTGKLPVELPPNLEKQFERALADASFDVWVGEDKILRRATLQVSGRGSGDERVDVDFRIDLSAVNESQAIDAPQNAKEGLPSGLYGQFATGFLAGFGGAVGVDPTTLGVDVPTTNAHLKAERAVNQGRKVVIFFENPRGLDDRAVANSVRELDRNAKNVVVLTDHVGNVDQYGSLVEDLGVNQAPSIVVIDRDGQGRLVEGYVDAETLAQVVADAR